MLARFAELAYGSSAEYRPDNPGFRAYLFPWEERTIAKFFPPPPARLLVGGAGGGREAYALAAQGYSVVAFEPSAPLAGMVAECAPAGTEVEAYRAAYDDLPDLLPARPGRPGARLVDLKPFDASIVGWGSFSHLRDEEARIRALSWFAEVTQGPILVSFLALRGEGDARRRLARLVERLPRRPGRSPGDLFSVHIGYYHPIDRPELERLAAAARLDLRYLDFDQRDTNWPHAVLARQY